MKNGGRLESEVADQDVPEFARPHIAPLIEPTRFYDAITELPTKANSRIAEAIYSYSRALLLAEPEPGFGRYEDKSLAVMLWVALLESMANPIKTACRSCGWTAAERSRRCGQCGRFARQATTGTSPSESRLT